MNLYDKMVKIARKKLKMTPLPHQSRVAKSMGTGILGQLVFHGLGSGKTFTAINTADSLKLPLIVIAPASLRENFKKEIKSAGLGGRTTVISYNEAVRDSGLKSFQGKVSRSLVVYDEVHNAGRTESSRSTLLKVLKPKKVLMLTGTPIRNFPSEMVPIMAGLGIDGAPKSTESFNDMFLDYGDDSVIDNIINAIMNSSKDAKPKNLNSFKKMLKGKVDFYSSLNPKDYPNVKEEVVDVPMDKKHYAAYEQMMNRNPMTKFKVEYGFTPTEKDRSGMMSFLIGPRMASNTPTSVDPSIPYTSSVKVKKMLSDIKKFRKKDDKFKGLVYSNFLDSGIKGVARGLTKANVPHDVFTGEMNDAQKRIAVKRYNEGKSKVILISGAGAEGIDLKGTKLVQVMEPHWNNSRVKQVIGRAARYMSHSHLPKKERKVVVKKYQSTLPKKWYEKLFRLKGRLSADQYIRNLANKKDELNQPFLNALREVGTHDKRRVRKS